MTGRWWFLFTYVHDQICSIEALADCLVRLDAFCAIVPVCTQLGSFSSIKGSTFMNNEDTASLYSITVSRSMECIVQREISCMVKYFCKLENLYVLVCKRLSFFHFSEVLNNFGVRINSCWITMTRIPTLALIETRWSINTYCNVSP